MVIYLTERSMEHQSRIRDAISSRPGWEFGVSPLVQLECLVSPKRSGDLSLESRYMAVLAQMLMLPFDEVTWVRATELRTRFGLKTPDALHLACAQINGCREFWTNDDRLSRAAMGLSLNLFRIAAS